MYLLLELAGGAIIMILCLLFVFFAGSRYLIRLLRLVEADFSLYYTPYFRMRVCFRFFLTDEIYWFAFYYIGYCVRVAYSLFCGNVSFCDWQDFFCCWFFISYCQTLYCEALDLFSEFRIPFLIGCGLFVNKLFRCNTAMLDYFIVICGYPVILWMSFVEYGKINFVAVWVVLVTTAFV